MERLIQRVIEKEAKRRIKKFSKDLYFSQKYQAAFEKRTGLSAIKAVHALPKGWGFHKQFDPRYCLNHSKFLARGLWRALKNGTYRPIPSLRVSIPKATSGHRQIDTFSVPDAAVAKIFLDNLRRRNSKIFSDRSYAYQIDKSPLDAIIALNSAMSDGTLFISQYDFSKFFDSIQHEHIAALLSKSGSFLTTKMERDIIREVMSHDFVEDGSAPQRRTAGTPQGNSLSLFVANAAAHPLDQQLNRLSGTFARFADDAVVVNTSYEDALKTADAFHSFSRESGIKINFEKSSGIRLFSESPVEMAHLASFDFLGYNFSRKGLRMSPRGVSMIKTKCAKIIYTHLLLYPRKTGFINKNRVGRGFRDWDLVTCVNELRSLIYGGRRQVEIDEYLNNERQIRNISGVVSYFSLVDDGKIFRELDGWLLSAISRAYAYRVKLLNDKMKMPIKPIAEELMIAGSWYRFKKIKVETSLPSFFTAWRASRKSWSRHGLGGIDTEGMGYAYI